MRLDPNKTLTHDRITLIGARSQGMAIMIGRCLFDIRRARWLAVAFFRCKARAWAVMAPRAWSVSLVASVCLLALALHAAPALAAEAESDTEGAESLFEEGLALQRLGQLSQACARFETSAELAASPHALLQVGNCREPDDPLGALASFQAALAAAGKVTDSTRRQAYEGAARKRIAQLEGSIPILTVHRPTMPNLRVELATPGGDARAITRFGEPQRLNPGKYRLTASAPGAEPYVLDLDLKPEQRLELDIPALGPQRRDAVEEAEERGGPIPVEPAPPSAEPAKRFYFGTGPVVLASAGGALVLTSLVTGRISSSARGELDRECAPPDELSGLRVCSASLAGTKSRVEDYALATDVLWITGSVLAGVGITWFLLDQNGRKSPALEAGCSGTGCGLTLTGSF